MAENGVIKKLTPAERSFYTAAEVRVIMDVSRDTAYRMIRSLRSELIAEGKIYSSLIERKTNDAKLPPSILEAKNKYIAQLTTQENVAIEQQHREQITEESERATPEYIDMLMREHGFKK